MHSTPLIADTSTHWHPNRFQGVGCDGPESAGPDRPEWPTRTVGRIVHHDEN